MKAISTRRFVPILTGSSIILMAIVAGMTMGLVFDPLFKAGPAGMMASIHANSSAFQFGVAGWIVILLCDLLASWGLYTFYKTIHPQRALFMGLFRVIYSLILGVAILNLIQILPSLKDANSESQEVYLHILSFKGMWQFGLILFGFHLLLLAPLVYKKRTIYQVISALLFLAGIGYVISNTANLIIADYDAYRPQVEAIFMLPMILGEVGLAFWLLIKEGKPVRSREKQYAYGSC